jgi:hypothetical protein
MSENQPVQTNQSNSKRRGRFGIVIVAVLLIVVLVVLLANYNPLSSHVTTVTQQQFLTNTQNIYSTQTVTNVGIITSQTTMTSTATYPITTYPTGSSYYQNCGYSTCYPPQYGYNGYYSPYYSGYNSYSPYYYNGYYNRYWYYGQSPYYCSNNTTSCFVNTPSQSSYGTACQSTGSNGLSQCSGYLHQDQNGCVELSIPLYSPYNTAQVYQYYTLYNLPSSYPSIGSYVTVSGQVYSGLSPGFPYGTSCPGNYINVSSIS